MKKVRVGGWYRFEPVMFDVLNPPHGAVPGDKVQVVNFYGCPKANVMGMCYVEKDGRFAGQVMTNSLRNIKEARS